MRKTLIETVVYRYMQMTTICWSCNISILISDNAQNFSNYIILINFELRF